MSLERPESDEALGRRLRDLPPPPVPVGLETRLIAAIPWPERSRGGSTRLWLATAVLLTAAASVLLAFRLPRVVQSPAVRVAVAPTTRPATLWTYEQALRRPGADASAMLDRVAPPFAWPVAGSRTAFLSDRYFTPHD